MKRQFGTPNCRFTSQEERKSRERCIKEVDKCLEHLCNRDSPVVWRLDRQGRSLKYLLTLSEDFNTSGIGFVSLTKSIDTTTGGGKLVFSINESERLVVALALRFHLSSKQIKLSPQFDTRGLDFYL
ncbi:recombinase family protein [Trichocoleus sp. DQ-A3]|uniref:recombinase family protein n=1 Tax=Cyanophyceae TaxID=3028117 RepID=UPI001682A473|nr:recombinase family protein [Coleofasciculus sp. FACHB-125]